MTGTAPRYLYVVRHGEASPDESTLTDLGRRQASLLGERLRGSAISVIHHGPLARAEQTARLIRDHLGDADLRASEPAGDYVPHVPRREELPPHAADVLLDQVAAFPAEERRAGPDLARRALALFTGPVEGDEPRHELLVTHNFLVGWLVRHALDAPDWRWLGVNQAHTGLTVIRYAPGRPSAVLVHNDTRHLPDELRWTGFPPELRV